MMSERDKMQDGNTHIGLRDRVNANTNTINVTEDKEKVTSGKLSLRERTGGVKQNTQQQFQDDAMEDTSNKMQDAVKQEQTGYFEQIWQSVKQPFKTFDTSLNEFSKGNVAEGIGKLIDTGLETFGAVFSPLAVGSEKLANLLPEDVKNLGMSKDVADTINFNLNKPATSISGGIDTILNQILPETIMLSNPTNNKPFLATKKDILNLGVPESVVNAINRPIRDAEDLAVQMLLFKKLENSLKTNEPNLGYDVKSVTNRQGGQNIEKPTNTSTPKLLDQPKRFTSSEVGDSKIVPTPQEQLAISQAKVTLDGIVMKDSNGKVVSGFNNAALELTNKVEVLTEQLKNKKTKANKEALKKANAELEEINAQRNDINSMLESYGTDLMPRGIKGTLPEATSTFGSGIPPIGKGENVPSGIDFSLPKEKIVELGSDGKPLNKQIGEVKDTTPLKQSNDAIYESQINNITSQMDKVTSEQFKDNKNKSEIFRDIDERIDALKNSVEVFGDTKYDEANHRRITEKLGYENWSEVPEELTVYRGGTDSIIKVNRGNGNIREYQNYTFDKEVAKRFGDAKEYKINKNDIQWVLGDNSILQKHVESEFIANPKDVIYAKAQDIIYEKNKPVETKGDISNQVGTKALLLKDGTIISDPEIIMHQALTNLMSKEQIELGIKDVGYLDKNGKFISDSAAPPELINEALKRIHKSNRIISDDAVKRADDYLKNNLNNVTSGGIFNPKLYQAVLVKGAYHLENGIIRYAEWSKKMIEEYGEKVRPMLYNAWNEIKKNSKTLNPKFYEKEVVDNVKKTITVDKTYMTPEKQKIVARHEETLSKGLSKFMLDENISKDTRDKIFDIIKRAEDKTGKKYTSSNLTYIRQYAFDKVSQFTKAYGGYGGELIHKLMQGENDWTIMNKKGQEFLGQISQIENKVGRWKFEDSFGKVVDALQDRKNAQTILGNDPIAQKTYPLMEAFEDYFKSEIQKRGGKVEEDYYMRRHRSSLVDELFNNKKADEINSNSIHEFITVNSKHLKERVKEQSNNIRKDFRANYTYLNSVTKELAYKDAYDYASKDFKEGVKNNPMLTQDLGFAHDALQNIFNPKKINSWTWNFAERRRQNVYTALLWNNIKTGISNAYQKYIADAYISPEAQILAKQIYKEKYQPTGRLLDAINEVNQGDPSYLGEKQVSLTKNKIQDFVNKTDVLGIRATESGNWKYSEGAGIINSVMKQTGEKTFEAINKALENQKVFDGAVKEARDLTARTQVSPNSTFRPMAYDVPFNRIVGMFTRYPLAMSDLFINTVIKNLEGVDGARAQNILRRGLSDDIKPVEFLRSVEYTRKNLEFALKSTNKEKYDLGVSKQVIKTYIDFFKKGEKELNSIIKEVEPLDKWRIRRKWGRYISALTTISFAYRLFESELWDAVGLNKDQRKKSVGEHLKSAVLDASPLPFYRILSGRFLNPPIAPNFEVLMYSGFNEKIATKELINYGTLLTPVIGTASQVYRRLTGNTVGSDISKEIFGSRSGNGGSR